MEVLSTKEKSLESLLGQEERDNLENKLTIDLSSKRGKARFAERVSAIANSMGGHIIIGVKDEALELVGIDPKEINEDQMQQIISKRCNPPVQFSVDIIKHNEKYFAIIIIPKTSVGAHQIRKTGVVWVRRGRISRPATPDEIYNMVRRIRGPEPNIDFLINEIYSPLFEEVNLMKKNVSELKNSFRARYGRPEFSAPLPRDKVPGSIRKTMVLTGKYELIPETLRKKLDKFYNDCEEYNRLLSESDSKTVDKQKQILTSSERLIEALRKKIVNPLD